MNFSNFAKILKYFGSTLIEKKWMYECEDIRRLIRDDKLELLNKHINSFYQSDWNTKGIKIKNIKITHLI